MPKRKPARRASFAEPVADYGPAFARHDGRYKPAWDGAASGLELAEVPDAGRPDQRATVRVARRIDPLIAILHLALDPLSGRVRGDDADKARYLAAEQFRRDAAIADGAAGWSESTGTRAIATTPGIGPSGAMLDAQTRVRLAWLAIRGAANDAERADVMRLIVLGFLTLEAVQQAQRCRRGKARETLLAGLDRLAAHYGLIRVAETV